MALEHKTTWSYTVSLLFLHLVSISREIRGGKKRFPYIEEAHLSSLLASIRTDKLDKLFQRLLRVVADGWVWEIRPRLLDDGWCWEVERRRRRMWTRCRKQNKTHQGYGECCFAQLNQRPLFLFLFFFSFLLRAQFTGLLMWQDVALDSSDGFSPLRL